MIAKGATVYRVVEHTAPGDAPDSWIVQERTVKSVGKAITLKSGFTRLWRIQFSLNAFGTLFFATPAEAVRDFAIKQRRIIESAARMVEEAEEALRWAEGYAQRAIEDDK